MRVATCRFEIGAARREQFPGGGKPEVAFLGRSNVGKSSLINSLLGGTGTARVSRTPGRTQQAHFYLVNEAFYFVDLPGYGYARAPQSVRERLTELIEEYLTGRKPLKVAVHLVDARHEPMQADVAMEAWLKARGVPTRIALTKVDKIPRGEWKRVKEAAASAFGTTDVIIHSSKTGEGRKELWQTISLAIAWDRTAT